MNKAAVCCAGTAHLYYKIERKRQMKNYSALKQLPLGRVNPRGWLLEQLKRNKDGIGGHLPELEPRMIATPYTTRETEPTWGEERKAGWGAEISGNYWNGLIELAYTLNDEELKAMATKWVDEVLANRRDDGYLGTYTDNDDMFDDYNAWGASCGMRGLLSYYSATGRRDVLDAVHDCMLWFCRNWAGDKKTRYAGIDIVTVMSECYSYTGDERLTRFCEEYYDFLERNDLFDQSLSALLSPHLHYNSNHGSAYAHGMSYPLSVYMMNGDKKYFDAAISSYRKARDKVIQKTGGITCESEYLAPLGATVETEYCGIAMYNEALGRFLYVTADPEYADQIERTVFNAGEGARKKDEKAIAYLHSPNQVFATDFSSSADHHHQVYAPCVPVACCPVMSVRLLPEFLRNSAMTGPDGSLWIAAYMPCRIDAGDIVLETETLYPFRDIIEYKVSTKAPVKKTLHFRIPCWCEGASISVNGHSVNAECRAKSFAELTGEWKDGDVISLALPMTVRVDHVDDSDRSSNFPVTFEYGPLLYALQVPESWDAYPGKPVTPLPEGWHWYNVNPVIPASGLDVYDDMGMRKHLISWNVAVDENITADAVKVEKTAPEGYPWENPPVKLRVPGFKAPYSYPPYPCKTFEPYGDKGRVYVTKELEIELVPFGCTALRISYFPRADLKK